MTNVLDSYTADDFTAKLAAQRFMLVEKATPADEPHAYLLGGQSGAGKTRLHKICASKLNGNVIVINGDEFRKSHPRFADIQATFGMDAPAHTAKWSGAMTEALIDSLSKEGFNLVIEGTLRTSKVPLGTAELLKSRGYTVSLAIMAVKPEISLISCQIRYEMMRIAGTTPRATDPEHHAKIVHDIVDNLAVLEQSGVFESIELYDRAGRRLEGASPSETLRSVLFGDWTEEERGHYAHLQQRLDDLRQVA